MLSRAATRLAAARPIATRQAAHANVTRALSSRESGVLSLLLSRGVSTPSFAARQRLQSLRTAADGAAADANQQYQLLKEANRLGDYAFVIGRVESNQFASNAGVKFEYNKALQTRQQKTQRQAYEQQQQQHQQQVSYADPAYAYHGQPYAPSYGSSAGAYAGGNSSAPGSAPSNPLILREVTPKISWSESFYGALPRIAIVLALWGAYTWYRHNHESDGTGGSLFSNPFGPTKDFLNREMSSVRFADVKGCDEAKAELQEVVEFLKNPTKFERLGGKMTKGVLLTGEPGTGKTLLAKAVAGEAGVPFFAASGAEFDEVFVGVGAKRVRELFAAARKQKRAIIFIDEIDAIGGNRDKVAASHGRATINALLTEMDGFLENSGIVVIGATNLDKVLDPALVRPGRFDRRVVVSLPDAAGRLEILQLYAKKMKLHQGVDLSLLSQSTSGMSGAELYNLLNTAAIRASANGKASIDHDEIEYAYDKILMGAERSFTQSAAVKASTAYHEAGHTIMLLNTPGAPPLHKVTILPRGRALGAMFFLPLNEHRILTREQLLAHIDICMGGRVAEEFLNGKDNITSGASNDLEQATAKARAMVTQYGMGALTGVFTLPDAGAGVNPAQVVSPETLAQIDEEVSRLLKDSYERSKACIATHRLQWQRLAQALIEHEVLDAKQVKQAVDGEVVTRKEVHKYRAPETQSPPPPPESGIATPKPTPVFKA